MSRVCELSGAKANNGMAVSHSHIRTKKLQQVNLQKRRLWWEEGKKWVNIKISTKALKSIQKVGLDKFAKSKIILLLGSLIFLNSETINLSDSFLFF